MIPMDEALTPQLTPEQLLQQLKDPVLRLVKEDVDEDADPEKIQQFLQVRKAHLYYDGKQHLAYHFFGDYVDFTPVGSPTSQTGRPEQDTEVYDYVINIVKGDGRKFAAVVGNRAPNAKGVANDQEDEVAIENARRAESIGQLLYAWWKMKSLHRYICLLLWKAGTVFGYTPFVVNRRKYGSKMEPILELQPQPVQPAGFLCPACGGFTGEAQGLQCSVCQQPLTYGDFVEEQVSQVPVQTGMEEYANGRVECYVFTALQVTIPFYSAVREDTPWLKLELEEHRGRLMDAYPQLREKLEKLEATSSTSSMSMSQGMTIRQSLSSPTGAWFRRKNLLTYTRYWLRPEMYNLVKESAFRDLLNTHYPEGLKVTRIQDEVIQLEHEKLDEVWAIGKPETSDFLYTFPLAWDHIQVQDIINTLVNIGVETLERAIPWMMADPEVVDFEQIRARARRPAEVVPAVPGQGKTLRDAVKESPVAQFSEQMMPFQRGVHETVREIAGVQRTIFGGEPQQQTTAREYEGTRAQALAQLTTTWDEIRAFLADLLRNGVRQLAKYGPRYTEAPSEGTKEMIDLQGLLDDNWHFEVEETMPVTPGQRADRLMFLLEKGPTTIGLLGLLHPQNAGRVQELLGMSGLYVPGADEISAVKEKVRELLQGAPIEAMGPMGPVMEPSIQPTWAEDSQFWVAAIKAWCVTPAGRRTEKENRLGWENVVAYGEAHERRLMAQMAQAAQATAPEKPAEPLAPTPFEPMPPRPEKNITV